MNPKNKSMVCRMAGNIAAGLLGSDKIAGLLSGYVSPSEIEEAAKLSVDVAVAIIADVELRLDDEFRLDLAENTVPLSHAIESSVVAMRDGARAAIERSGEGGES